MQQIILNIKDDCKATKLLAASSQIYQDTPYSITPGHNSPQVDCNFL